MELATEGPGGGKISVLCDFDGTITLIDTAEFLLDRYADGDWRRVEDLLEDGRITIDQCMSTQFAMISLSRQNMLTELDKVVVPRPGFSRLLDACSAGSARFRVTSAGLDFYIRHFLAANGWGAVEVVAPEVMDNGSGVSFRFPPIREPQARNFKEDQVLRERASGRRVAYIGDGVSDLWAALSADHAFAVRASRLDRLLSREGKEHRTFTDLGEVAEALFPSPAGLEVHGP
ncbi:MAG: HAD-IB family phosphatase [Methanomassiliicoccus sp.]|nr:HAD-IB family phosphatase [Methanomassiliicoccus sp.]